MRSRWFLVLIVVAGLATLSCASSTDEAQPAAVTPTIEVVAPDESVDVQPTVEAIVASPTEPAPSPTPSITAVPTATPTPTPTPLGERLERAPIGFEQLADQFEQFDGPRPVGLSISSIDVADAPVISVGVNDDLTMEVPDAEDVGWYRFGASPGQAGSAVLAAHIAYDGVDGVFRNLIDTEPGDMVDLVLDDGTSQRWRIVSVTDYEKEALPDELFDVDGSPRLALITCGGAFNPELRSYDSNTVAVAVPA